jgi:hypothetical protein
LHPSQKAPQGSFGNDAVSPTKPNNVVLPSVEPFSPHMQSDTVSPLNSVSPRTLKGVRKKQHDVVLSIHPKLDPTQPATQTRPKWKTIARKSAIQAQAQKLKAQASISSSLVLT